METRHEKVLNTERENEAIGHICEGVKTSGKRFLAKYAYAEGENLVIITKFEKVIKNRRDILESLRVVI